MYVPPSQNDKYIIYYEVRDEILLDSTMRLNITYINAYYCSTMATFVTWISFSEFYFTKYFANFR